MKSGKEKRRRMEYKEKGERDTSQNWVEKVNSEKIDSAFNVGAWE